MWLSPLILLGIGLSFGCAMLIYRKYSRNRLVDFTLCHTCMNTVMTVLLWYIIFLLLLYYPQTTTRLRVQHWCPFKVWNWNLVFILDNDLFQICWIQITFLHLLFKDTRFIGQCPARTNIQQLSKVNQITLFSITAQIFVFKYWYDIEYVVRKKVSYLWHVSIAYFIFVSPLRLQTYKS